MQDESDESPNVLDYRGPAVIGDGAFIRSGAFVVGPINTPFPPRCIKCNAPADWRWTRNLYWVPRGVNFLAFGPGIVVYAIVATIMRKKSRVSVAMCDRHRQQRRLYRFIAVPFIVLGLGFCSLAIYLMQGTLTDSFMPTYVLGIGLVLLLGGVVWLKSISRVIKLRKIEDGVATYGGVGIDFLRSLDVRPLS